MPKGIESVLLSSIVEGRLPSGSRLSENELAEAFGVSRTKVREALHRLEGRHIINSQPRKGWFVKAPDAREAAQIFAARRAIEYGFLATAKPFGPHQIAPLAAHLAEEREAIRLDDKTQLTYLMGDYHVRIAAQTGNDVLVQTLSDLTARTMLISLRVQTMRDALASHDDHVAIFQALEAGDMQRAAQLSHDHLETVEAGIAVQAAPSPVATLRSTLRLDAEDESETTTRIGSTTRG